MPSLSLGAEDTKMNDPGSFPGGTFILSEKKKKQNVNKERMKKGLQKRGLIFGVVLMDD